MTNNMTNLLVHRCTYWKGKLYCITRSHNLLFSVDLQDGKIELIDVIPERNILESYLPGYMSVWNNKLIISPNKTNKIWIYDFISKYWNSYPIKGYDHWGSGGIYQVYEYNNKLFLIGGSYPAILCLDLENNSCEYIEKPYEEVKARHAEINYYYFRAHGARLDNTLYLASCLDNFVLKFNMETFKHQWIKIGDDNFVYSGIAWDGHNFWIAPRSGSDIVKWDGKEKIKKFPLPDNLKQHTGYIWEACYNNGQIIFPATNHKKSIMINVQNDTFEIYDQQYPLYTRLDNGMVVNQTLDGTLSVKAENIPEKIFSASIETDQLMQFYKEKNIKIYKGQTIYYETLNNPMLSLDVFLKLSTSDSPQKTDTDNQIGKTIWENIR